MSLEEPAPTMERSWTKPMRSNTLSNSAVEFIETRPEQAFGSEVAGMIGSQQVPQYTPEIDRFVAASEFAQQDYFKESEQRMVRFKETLSGFCKTLEERKLGKKLGIEIKKPGDYQMQDVLQIAQDLQSKHQSDSEARGCLGKIRRCFRQVAEHRGTLHNLLSCLPNDTYGAPICGGFTVILGALDRAEDLREEVYAALGEIPRQLQQTSAVVDIHKHSRRLKSLADSVFIAIFELLESIVKELTKSVKKKTVTLALKGEHYGTKITTAIESLERAVKAFNDEARVCDSRRLGRMEEHAVGTRLSVEGTNIKLDEFRGRYEEDRIALGQGMEYQNRRLEELPAMMVNMFYHFLASNPSFDVRNGRLDQSQVQGLRSLGIGGIAKPAKGSSSRADQSARENIEARRSTARSWLREANLPDACSLNDVDECLTNMNTLVLGEKDKVQWILGSDEVRSWLTTPNSSSIAIEAETPPQDLVNPITAASAFLAKSIASNARFPVLTFMGGFQASEGPSELACDAMAILRSITAQLLLYIAEDRPSIDLGFLKKKRYRQKPLTTLPRLVHLFGRLLYKLSEDGESNAVFIILDSITRLDGSMHEATQAVAQLLDTIESGESVVKLLLTDLGSPLMLEVEERNIPILFLPDNVDGGKQDLNVEMLEEDTSLSIEDFRSSQRKSDREDDSLDGEDSDDSHEDEYVLDR